MRDLDQRIEEAKKQTVEGNLDSADKYRAVELELKNEEPYSEDLESQTLRIKTKMVDEKYWVLKMHQSCHQGDPRSYKDLSGRLRIYGENVVWIQMERRRRVSVNMPIKRVKKSGELLRLLTRAIPRMSLKRSYWITIWKHLQLNEECQLEFSRLFGSQTMLNWETL